MTSSLAQRLRSMRHHAFLALAVLALLLTPLRLACFDGCDEPSGDIVSVHTGSDAVNDQGTPSDPKDTDGCGHCHCPVPVALVAPHPVLPWKAFLAARRNHVPADDICAGFVPSPDPFPDRA